jgi:hypothetical protein
LPDVYPPGSFHSSFDPTLAFWRKRTDLHGPERCGWAARRPIESYIKGGEFHNHESPELLLGIREGPILNAPLPFLKPYRGPCLWHLKRFAAEVGTGLD